jgi:hypothetical protein
LGLEARELAMPALELEAGACRRPRGGPIPSIALHHNRAGAPEAREALRYLRVRERLVKGSPLLKRLDRHHDWLVVIGLVLPEPEEPALEEPEPPLPEVAEGAELVELDELGELVELDDPVDPDVDAAVPLELWPTAGSCPETSWTKITPHTRAKVEAATASARFRTTLTRRRRAVSRAATPARASLRASALGSCVGSEVS